RDGRVSARVPQPRRRHAVPRAEEQGRRREGHHRDRGPQERRPSQGGAEDVREEVSGQFRAGGVAQERESG
ncbi:hypothetical protein LTR16_011335, partial [Cryomyces antarcticus]